MPVPDSTKIIVPRGLYAELRTIARRHERTIQGELRVAIRAHIEDVLLEEQREERRRAIRRALDESEAPGATTAPEPREDHGLTHGARTA
jgi:rRNA-processing protein FCF1